MSFLMCPHTCPHTGKNCKSGIFWSKGATFKDHRLNDNVHPQCHPDCHARQNPNEESLQVTMEDWRAFADVIFKRYFERKVTNWDALQAIPIRFLKNQDYRQAHPDWEKLQNGNYQEPFYPASADGDDDTSAPPPPSPSPSPEPQAGPSGSIQTGRPLHIFQGPFPNPDVACKDLNFLEDLQVVFIEDIVLGTTARQADINCWMMYCDFPPKIWLEKVRKHFKKHVFAWDNVYSYWEWVGQLTSYPQNHCLLLNLSFMLHMLWRIIQ